MTISRRLFLYTVCMSCWEEHTTKEGTEWIEFSFDYSCVLVHKKTCMMGVLTTPDYTLLITFLK